MAVVIDVPLNSNAAGVIPIVQALLLGTGYRSSAPSGSIVRICWSSTSNVASEASCPSKLRAWMRWRS